MSEAPNGQLTPKEEYRNRIEFARHGWVIYAVEGIVEERLKHGCHKTGWLQDIAHG